VEKKGIARRPSKWVKLDVLEAATDFPCLFEEELRCITIGVYQLKQVKSYTNEHLNEEGNYDFFISSDIT